ncbi:FAD-dependent oxidoreductase [Allonocardiopsis opalescens]|uniref:FAD/FMN-containing dehydrogenase n=1 Tax=Allonocardiopsis opalescens TaxID=1144618 RepID=A0A2T0Q0F2_9ACTN|nr:FAD-binding protein [Allonocardiopsis opalescens]PRX97246.1 FAD/FMN-containing dehydrogenase [Allonocardiopsis opalescens]
MSVDPPAPDPAGIRILPDDTRYPSVSRGFNPRWHARPEYVRLVATPQEAAAALQEAVQESPRHPGKDRITVRSGGHCYENFVCAPDVRMIIDVSLMNGIYPDEEMGAVCIEAGATNGDLRKRLFLTTGKVLPGGSCPSVGAGGHVPAGGFGLLSRQYGLTVDYLYAVEVAVVRDGRVELVRASSDTDDIALNDLWWAHTGGGGGNFGVLTRMWFRGLPTAPEHVILSAGGWKWSGIDKPSFTRIVQNFGDFFERHSEPDDPFGALFAILLLNHATQDKIGLIAQIDASVPDADRLMTEFHDAMTDGPHAELALEPLTEGYGEYPAFSGLHTPTPLPWDTVEKLLGPVDNNRCGKHKSAYMQRPLPDHHIDAMWDALTEDLGPGVKRDAVVQIDSYGSQVNVPAPDATAVDQRSSIIKLQHQVYWPAPGAGEAELAWIRRLYKTMYSDTGGVPVRQGPERKVSATDGCYIGYPDVDLNDPEWNESGQDCYRLYYGDNYQRLQRAKAYWDPDNVFRSAQSVRLPGAER